MSNNFKQQSRFSVLVDDNESSPTKPLNNNFNKKENNMNTRYGEYENKRNKFNYNPEKQKQKLKELEKEKIKKDLEINSFPELGSKTIDVLKKHSPKLSFLETLQLTKEDEKDEEKETEKKEMIKDGCVSITFKNKKVKYTFGKMTYLNDLNNNNKLPTPHFIMSNLVTMNENRKAKYIENWGEEDYEKTFLSPNYDYDYFNKLDDIYEMEMLESNKEESDEEYFKYNRYV